MNAYSHQFYKTTEYLAADLLNSVAVNVPYWQAQDVSDTPLATTYELRNVVIEYSIPTTIEALQAEVEPNLPWAEDHFQERVSGTPHNPPPSAAWWPYSVDRHKGHVDQAKKFSHTYPERMWPRRAGENPPPHGRGGIRFAYGDLNDLLKLLEKEPYTRQAYLPIWFPEDLDAAANHQQRVPCTLGYHFLLRDGHLHCFYPIRSCDFVRHFRDDVYMAARLCQWVVYWLWWRERRAQEKVLGLNEWVWDSVEPGTLTMHAVSFHCFEGDIPKLRREYES